MYVWKHNLGQLWAEETQEIMGNAVPVAKEKCHKVRDKINIE